MKETLITTSTGGQCASVGISIIFLYPAPMPHRCDPARPKPGALLTTAAGSVERLLVHIRYPHYTTMPMHCPAPCGTLGSARSGIQRKSFSSLIPVTSFQISPNFRQPSKYGQQTFRREGPGSGPGRDRRVRIPVVKQLGNNAFGSAGNDARQHVQRGRGDSRRARAQD